MNGLNLRIGGALRALRSERKKTLAVLAEASGVSAPMISKIERGIVTPSLTTLESLAHALETPIGRFFTGRASEVERSLVGAGEGLAIRRQDGFPTMRQQLVGLIRTDGIEFEPSIVTLDNPLGPARVDQHPGVGFIHLLEGAMSFHCNHETLDLKTGDSLTFDTTAPHGIIAIDKAPVRYLSVVARPRTAS